MTWNPLIIVIALIIVGPVQIWDSGLPHVAATEASSPLALVAGSALTATSSALEFAFIYILTYEFLKMEIGWIDLLGSLVSKKSIRQSV